MANTTYLKNNGQQCEAPVPRAIFPIGLLSYFRGEGALSKAFYKTGHKPFALLLKEQREEIYDVARTYTEKYILGGCDGAAIIASPAVFPASSLCLCIEIDASPSEVYRMINERKLEDRFIVAPSISTKRQRISESLRRSAGELGALIDLMDRCIGNIQLSPPLSAEELNARFCAIAELVDSPSEAVIAEGEYSRSDIGLSVAFILSTLMIAREIAPSRSAEIRISSLSSAAVIETRISGITLNDVRDESLEWEYIASSRYMTYWSYEAGDAIVMKLHAYRHDWSVGGIKDDQPWIRK